jgi:stress response protein SCP2
MVIPLKGATPSKPDIVYFSALTGFDGAIKHSGDARKGDDDDGDDESVVIKPDGIPADVTGLVIGVIAYNVPDMSAAKNTKLTIRDGDGVTAPELYTMPMEAADIENETILVAAILERDGDQWKARSIAEFRNDFAHQMAAVNGLVDIAGHYL